MNDETTGSKIHIFFYLLFIAALGISGYFNYLYFMGKQPPAELGIDTKAVCESFDQLPHDVRSLYVDAVAYNELKMAYEKLEQDMRSSSMTSATAKNESSKVMREVPVKDEMSDNEMMDERPMTGQSVRRIKDFAKCYDMGNASYKISGQCRKDIINYVDRHKDAKYFEIIALIDDAEFRLFRQLERDENLQKKLGTNQKLLNKMKKLTQRGLGKNRAGEASWVIKSYTKREAATYNANYELISKKGHRGVIVRAYK